GIARIQLRIRNVWRWREMALDNMADRGSRKLHVSDHVRGAVIMLLGCVVLVGLAFGAMILLTSPDGWVAKAANSAMAGEQPALVSFDLSSAN
ncbi:MAG TPA: hypothetical protein VFV70_14755, partial [Hyphomonadaceae bacterium]|nr:hypothetical protein [Hyphomonadaceae bacterium]